MDVKSLVEWHNYEPSSFDDTFSSQTLIVRIATVVIIWNAHFANAYSNKWRTKYHKNYLC